MSNASRRDASHVRFRLAAVITCALAAVLTTLVLLGATASLSAAPASSGSQDAGSASVVESQTGTAEAPGVGSGGSETDPQSGEFQFEVYFDSYSDQEVKTFDATMDYAWFGESAEVYNHDLAQLSMCMAFSAFRPVATGEQAHEDPSEHLRDFMTRAGFGDLRVDDYDKSPTLYTVSTVIGSRELVDDEGPYTLVACGVCGGRYRDEWMSNFTVGTGERHQGFNDAARHVNDRIFGYIAENGIRGRVKLWIAGFSRGGAISNIVGANMVDYGVLDRDDIFVYTFASPRTTTNPKEGEYPNIFNIVGKMDVVPQVPFADWGFARYGIDLETPAQETDDYYSAVKMFAEEVYQELIGIDFWNNVEMNSQLKTVMSYVLAITPTREVYTEHVQPLVIDVMTHRDAFSLINAIFTMASDEELINDENSYEASSLLDYALVMLRNYIFKSGAAFENWHGSATLSANIMHEHTPDVYLAWLYSSEEPELLYSQNHEYIRVAVQGDVDLVLRVDYDSDFVQRLKANGEVECEDLVIDSQGNRSVQPINPPAFMFRSGESSVYVGPISDIYTLEAVANTDGIVDCFYTEYRSDRTAGVTGLVTSAELDAGQTLSMFDLFAGDKANEWTPSLTSYAIDYQGGAVSYSPGLVTQLENVNVLGLSWVQVLLLLLLFVLVLIVGLILLAVGLSRRHRRVMESRDPEARFAPPPKSNARRLVFVFVSMLAIYVFSEVLVGRFGVSNMVALVLRSAALVLVAFVALTASLRTRRLRDILITFAIIAFVVGGVFVNSLSIVAVIVYAIAHFFIIAAFFVDRRPNRIQWVVWALGLAILLVAFLSRQDFFGAFTIPFAALLAMLFTMVVLAWGQVPIVRLASALLALSDLLVLVLLLQMAPVLRVPQFIVFILANYLLAYEIWRRSFGPVCQGDGSSDTSDE